jgi:thymidylate synthase
VKNYHDLIAKVLKTGEDRKDRTGTGTLSIFDARLTYQMSDGFPLLTTKQMPFRSIMAELCFFINGERNIRDLHKYGCTIWDEWADETGDLGRIYGVQWRNWIVDGWGTVDQFREVFEFLQREPESRRHLVSAWNVSDLEFMALPPCHYAFEFYVSNLKSEKTLNLKVHMRSADLFLGVPFNIASYAALLMLFSLHLGMKAGELIMDMTNVHIYKNHIDQCKLLLTRNPEKHPLPTLLIAEDSEFISAKISPNAFTLWDYVFYPKIAADISI